MDFAIALRPVKALAVGSFVFLWFIVPSLSAEAAEVGARDNPTFSSRDQSVWGPRVGFTRRDFRLDIVDLHERGTTPYVNNLAKRERAAERVGSFSLVCPSGTFWGGPLNDGCYRCPAGYAHDPLTAIGDGECFRLTGFEVPQEGSDTQAVCPSGQFLDAFSGQCFSCPDDSYRHNPAVAAADPGACYKDVSVTDPTSLRAVGCDASRGEFDGGDGRCYTCPSGYETPLIPVALGGQCHKPAQLLTDTMAYCGNRTWDSCDYRILGICVGGWDYNLGNCRSHRIRKPGTNKYYDCDSGYSHNPLIAFNNRGICYRTVAARDRDPDFAHDFYCGNSNASFDGLDGYCYACPDDTLRTPAIPWVTPGSCVAGTVAAGSDFGDPGIACPAGEFFDLDTQRCYACPDGAFHNPVLGAGDAGVCYTREETTSEFVGDERDFAGCGQGEFPVPPDECWSCGEGYVKNPLVLFPDAENSCFTLQPVVEDSEHKASVSVDYDIDLNFGIDGYVEADGGTVSVDYEAGVDVSVRQVEAAPQEIYEMSTELVSDRLDWGTSGPSVELSLDPYLDSDNHVTSSVRFPYLDEASGQLVQGVETRELFSDSTHGETRLAEDPLITTSISGEGLGLTILGTDILGGDGFRLNTYWDVHLMTVPTKIVRVGFPLFEYRIHTPILDTPAGPLYLGATSGDPGTGLQSLGPGSRLSDTFFSMVASTDQDPDALRVDLDVDGLYFAAQKLPLGVVVRQKLGKLPLYTLDYSFLDFDTVLIASFDKKVSFDPRLRIELRFSKSVRLETVPGGNRYESASKRLVAPGERVRFIHPGGDVEITPVYTLVRNRFTNDTDLVLAKMLEFELSSVRLRAPFFSSPKLAALQGSVDIGTPDVLAHLNFMDKGSSEPAIFDLRDFEDVVGTTLTVRGTNEPPVALCRNSFGLVLDGADQAVVAPADLDAGSFDPEGAPGFELLVSREVFGCVDTGTHEVVLTAVDGAGLTASCNSTVSVRSAVPLSVDAGPDIVREADSRAGTEVDLPYQVTGGCGAVAIEASPDLTVFPIGRTRVVVTAVDAAGTAASDDVLVEIFDAPPLLTAPPDIETEATAPLTPIAMPEVTATDRVDGTLPATHDAPGRFPVGETAVTWSVEDSGGNAVSVQSIVRVVDTTPPALLVPDQVVEEGNAEGGAVLALPAVLAEDIADPAPVVACSADGGFFALGNTLVTCTATDASGNSASAAYPVIVVDTTPPSLTVPSDITVEGNVQGGAITSIPAATAADIVDATPEVGCDRASGRFDLGSTLVTCTAADDSGNVSRGVFTVLVVDTTPPELSVPDDILVEGNVAGGALVDVPAATAADIVDASPTVTCTAGSGFFGLGATSVGCAAADDSGNEARAAFVVAVQDTTPPVLVVTTPTEVLWPANHRHLPIPLEVSVEDIVDRSPGVESVASSNEPDDAKGGDGATTGDIRVETPGGVVIRSSNQSPSVSFDPRTDRLSLIAERSGRGSGRRYVIDFVARDGSGNTATSQVVVAVPHDRAAPNRRRGK